MNKFDSIEEVLNYAIEREIESNQFYKDLAAKMDYPVMRKVFEKFAKEELGHKAKLEAMKKGKHVKPASVVRDLHIADYIVDVEPAPPVDYRDALIIAMKKEKASYRLYIDLSEQIADEKQKKTFLTLAQEEAQHKLRFEVEYEKEILKEA